VRAAVWSANYPRASIGRYTGRIVIVSSLAVAAAAALAAWTLEHQWMDSRWLFGAGAAAGLVAAWLYRRARVRREFVLLAEEVNPVIRDLEAHGIDVTALHSHMLRENPRLFFMHFWAVGAPDKIGEGLKSALSKIATK